MERKNHRGGFTLVELLVVIGIIALLISILMPSLAKARAAAISIQCASQMRQIGTAIYIYAGENRGSLPPTFAGYANVAAGATNVATKWFINSPGSSTLFLDILPRYGIKSNANRICPAVVSIVQTTMAPKVNYWNYKYNAVLGGTQYTTTTGPYYSYKVDAAGNAWARPMKQGFKHASDTAMLTESNSIGAWPVCNAQQIPLYAVNAQGQQQAAAPDWDVVHNLKYAGGVYATPWAPTIRPKKVGYMNICFADGSVRSTYVKYNANPSTPWGDGSIKIDPRQ